MSDSAFPPRKATGFAPRFRGGSWSGKRKPAGLWILLAALGLCGAPARADPDYGGLILPGLDPVLRSTRDPRLLGAERLALRQRLLLRGVDPLWEETAGADLPDLLLANVYQRSVAERQRRDTTVEIDGVTGLASVFEYPRWLALFPPSERLAGGFFWNPPRHVDEPTLDLYIDDLDAYAQRRLGVSALAVRAELLDVKRNKGGRDGRDGLLNLTIPIKLPRTLEKIIGRGEKTMIKVSGREHIALSGESRVSNKFVATERRQSQSLFPTLDMEQQLQINLAGTIGEKIQIEVDHNSEAMGPEATKIKLAYRGDEDEVIQSIETGDVGLTLPGSQLLGYSSNKSGLFGIKVTGACGRADFTVVASKQKAESAAKSFNSRGGEVTEHSIECQNYLKFRFFRLDLPPGQFFGPYAPDDPGRPAGAFIDPSSVQIFVFDSSGLPGPDEVKDVALYLDASGRWEEGGVFSLPPVVKGLRWRRVTNFALLLDQNGNFVAIDLKEEYAVTDKLGVIYDVVGDLGDPSGTLLYEVGDDPGLDEDARVDIDGTPYLRMKLLKPDLYNAETAHAWGYPLKNIYHLGGSNIDAESFDLRVEYTGQATVLPAQDLSGLDWIRIFGLDRTNPQRSGPPDGYVDKEDQNLFDLQAGLLKFPLDFPEPFNAAQAKYEEYAATADTFIWAESQLSQNLVPQIYDYTLLNQFSQYNKFRLVAKHAAASGTIDLHDSNIEEGSETVILDGQTLQRGVDYDIDYTFGQISLRGDAVNRLSPDSQISVNYQYAPFMGGGNSNLLGFNLGFDLGRASRISTTWLFETNQIAGYKAKLGEEPSRTLVGNLNVQHTFEPYFLTHVANFLARRDTDRPSTVQLNGEVALSVPNPNTKGDVFLEDFEGIDASDVMPISRLSWMLGSSPATGRDAAYVAETADDRDFAPEMRVDTRWYLPKDSVLRRYLNPELREEEGREPQQVLQLWLDGGASGWQEASWGGIMRGLGRSGIDLTRAQFLEFWVNDFRPDQFDRRGTLHVDFGYVSEDFNWPSDGAGGLEVGTFQFEDANRDGVFTNTEDTGLDGIMQGAGGPDYYSADFVSYDNPFPTINGTEANFREDTEDLDGDTLHETRDGYFTITVDLADSALVDVLRDYPPELTANIPQGQAWRKFRIRINNASTVTPAGGASPRIDQITHVRVWYEDRSTGAPSNTALEISDLKFLGSRWEREGIRKRLTEDILTPAERGPGESFFIGEVNNKENPDYYSPFNVRVERDIMEKESSLVLDFNELERDHLVRVSKYVSPRGDNYTQYGTINWWWFCPRTDLGDMDLFFRIGGDTLNYYEVSYRFDEGPGARSGWRQVNLDLAQLTNAKFADYDSVQNWIATTVTDVNDGHPYRVRVVGKPDLRRVKRYYFGVINEVRDQPVSGYFFLNDVRLESVKRESGMAKHAAARLNMADVVKIDFDWSGRDADFHGLNANRGQGFTNEDWSLSGSTRVDDFMPLLGYQMPVSFSRRQTIQRPKYLTNSDVELIDADVKNAQSTVDTRESYSVRLNHSPSRVAVLRYMLDPWAFSYSGSNSSQRGPLEHQRLRNSQGSLVYDLSIPRRYDLGRYLFFGAIPVLGDVAILPRKISFGGNVSRSRRQLETVLASGAVKINPEQTTHRGTLNGSLEYTPLTIADVSLTMRSDRDLLRRRQWLGVNVGEEINFSQGIQVRFNLPKLTGLPKTALLEPARAGLAALNAMRPQVTFNGGYEVNKDPSIRQAGDPAGIRSISNSGDWDFRLSVPVDRFIKSRFPERGKAEDLDRRETIERQRRLGRRTGRESDAEPAPLPEEEQEAPAPGDAPLSGAEIPAEEQPPAGPAPAPGDVPASPTYDDEALTPEERLRLEEEALLEQARQRDARERQAREDREPAAADSVAGKGQGIKLPNPGKLLLNALRGMAPIQAQYSLRRTSSYARLSSEDNFWYRLGLSEALDVADSLYAISRLTDRASVNFSTNFKFSRGLSADVKFVQSTGFSEQAGLLQKQYQQDWPDLRLALTGLERWSIFKGQKGDGWFRASGVDIGYKHSKTVSGATSSQYNPRTSTTISPRWNMTFANQMTATLNVGITRDRTLSNGTETASSRLNIGVQMRHSFRAERFLAKLKLYKPGAIPTVNMDVDVTYNRQRDERRLPGATVPDAQTGQDRISFNPRFSYQITKNLTGAMRLGYSRDKSIQTDTVTQTFGLGVEATFVF